MASQRPRRLDHGPRRVSRRARPPVPRPPLQEQTRKWRDQILLDEAEGRAKTSSSPVKTQLTEPNDQRERQVRRRSTASPPRPPTRGRRPRGRDATGKRWPSVLKPDDPDERPLVPAGPQARRGARDEDHATAGPFVDRAARAGSRPRSRRAVRPRPLTIRAMLDEKYGQYTDLADLLGHAGSGPARSVAPGTASRRSNARPRRVAGPRAAVPTAAEPRHVQPRRPPARASPTIAERRSERLHECSRPAAVELRPNFRARLSNDRCHEFRSND